jgi:chorismate mutase
MRVIYSSLLFACAALAAAVPAQADDGNPIAELVASSATRLSIGEQVALTKWDNKNEVEDLAREDVVIRSAREQGTAQGLDPAWVGGFFRAQIEASKELQHALLADWRRAGTAPVHLPIDLVNNIRPRLDNLQIMLLRQLAEAAPLRKHSTCDTQVADAVAKYARQHQLEAYPVRVSTLTRAMSGFCAPEK